MFNPIQLQTTTKTTAKRQKPNPHNHRQPSPSDHLIPGLPDHISHLCLSLLHPSLLFSVCRSWRRVIYSPTFPPFLSLYTLLSQNTHSDHYTAIQLFNFDPISSTWEELLPPPLPLPLILRHPSFISRHLPVQSLTASGHLILLAATGYNFLPALSRPLIFNPSSCQWSFGPELTAPRRWCAAGTINNNTIYIASGIGSKFSAYVAKLVEKWEFERKENGWERVRGLKDGRFSRDAIDAIGFRGKLCMVNVRGDAPKEGLVYNTKEDLWEDMPEGMLAGWKGPVAAMEEEVMYAVDEVSGELRKYEAERDEWESIVVSDKLKGAEKMAAGGGRLCVVCGGGSGIVVVDVVAAPVRLWTVDLPPGFEAVAVHILPRMSKPELGFPVEGIIHL